MVMRTMLLAVGVLVLAPSCRTVDGSVADPPSGDAGTVDPADASTPDAVDAGARAAVDLPRVRVCLKDSTTQPPLTENVFGQETFDAYANASCSAGICQLSATDCIAQNSYTSTEDDGYGAGALRRVGLLVADPETGADVGAEMRYETDTRGNVLFMSVGGPIARYNDAAIHKAYADQAWVRVVDIRFLEGAVPDSKMATGYKTRTSPTQVMSFTKASARWAALARFAHDNFAQDRRFALSACSNGGEMVARALIQHHLGAIVDFAEVNSGPAMWDMNCFCSRESGNGCPVNDGALFWAALIRPEIDYMHRTKDTCARGSTHAEFASDSLKNDPNATWSWPHPSRWNVTIKRDGQGVFNSWTDTDFGLDNQMKATFSQVKASTTASTELREWLGPTTGDMDVKWYPDPTIVSAPDGWIHCSYLNTETLCNDLCTGFGETNCASVCAGQPWISDPRDMSLAF